MLNITNDQMEPLRAEGREHEKKRDWVKAEGAYRRLLMMAPSDLVGLFQLASVLEAQGRLEEAIAAYFKAMTAHPNRAEIHYNIAILFGRVQDTERALEHYERALAINPNLVQAQFNRGNLLKGRFRWDEAAAAFRAVLAVAPQLVEAQINLANAVRDLGMMHEAMNSYREILGRRPELAQLHSNLLQAMLCRSDRMTEVRGEAERWNGRYAAALGPVKNAHRAEALQGRPLRIGYVSGDMVRHSVSNFLLPLLEGHDRERVHVTCYASNGGADEVTESLKKRADAWRSIAGVGDEAAAEMVREDRIDVLVDLGGHTAGGRLLIFARRPAAVQVAWLGFAGTTGLPAIGFRLTDGAADPVGMTEGDFVEELVRLPGTAWCFSPLAEVGAAGPRREGPVVFGSFNNFSKCSEEILELWTEILRRAPGSRLLLKNGAMGSASAVARLRDFFGARGVDAGRLDLRARAAETGEHLRLYQEVDIGLDTFPYHGTTTTCEALWMGVPVVTLAGKAHVSRVGVSLLGSVGLPELVAATGEEYVRMACELAGDGGRLAMLRGSLRARMEGSRLMDGRGFARGVEEAYFELWRRVSGHAEA